jgi:pimeloyl-ACP methyl ester carboxylesterase
MPSLPSADAQPFELPTRDGHTCIRGEIDWPKGDARSRFPVVLIVNGGWFMERDGFMGNSGTERDLIYRELAKGLVAAGVAAVRYDNRGVSGNEMTMPACADGKSEPEITRHYLKTCIDADVRKTVSVQTQLDDVEQVWEFAVNHPRVDPQRVVVWAHSEGGLNVARLISAERIRPLGVITVGAPASSPAESAHWIMVNRYAEQLMRWDEDADGRVTQADVDRHYPNDSVFPVEAIKPESLAAPGDGWTMATALDHFETIYAKTKAATQAKPDDSTYPPAEHECLTIAASNNWYRQWFEDTQPMIDHFAEYRGHTSLHFGEIDSQFSGPREMAFAEQRIKDVAFIKAPRLVFHQARGHSLRTGEPCAGPMDDEVSGSLVKEVHKILSGTCTVAA